MPDGYENTYGLNPADAEDEMADADGDRVPNLYEYIHEQTDPSDATNLPGATATVSTSGHDGTYTNIQNAVNAAIQNETNGYPIVLIEPGAYAPLSADGIALTNDNILIYGTNAHTIIDCEDSGRAFYISSGRPIISGLVMQKGTSMEGGAIYISNAEPLIRNCVLWDNWADDKGGAIYAQSSIPVLENCTLINNKAIWASSAAGAAIYGSSSVTVTGRLKCTTCGRFKMHHPRGSLLAVNNSAVK